MSKHTYPAMLAKSWDITTASEEAIETARDTIAHTHQLFDHTRQLRKETRAISQYNRQLFEHTQQLRKETRAISQHNRVWHVHEAAQETCSTTAVLSLSTPTMLMHSTPLSSVEILLIEDNPADIQLFREALKQCKVPCQLLVLTQRNEVVAFADSATTSARASYPQLIILDFEIPGMEAKEILTVLRGLPAYKRIPVIVFSSFEETEGQRRSAQLSATAFVQKPGELQAFFTAVCAMVCRWSKEGRGQTLDSEHEE